MKQYRISASTAAELVREIEAGVAGGSLTPGQRLPSVRRLAVETGLSPVTVAAGLADLRRRGVVVSEQRRATRIAHGPPVGPSAGPPHAPLHVPPGARDLSRGNPDPELLPDLDLALARCRLPRRLYGEPQALPELVALVAEQLRADGLPDGELCITGGAMDAIERVLAVHLRPGDRVAVENPGYAALYDVLRAHGLVLEPVGVDQRGMLAAELRRALSHGAGAVVITPRAQNPTGAALDADRTRELRAVLVEFPDALVIEDDHLGALAGTRLHTVLGDGRPPRPGEQQRRRSRAPQSPRPRERQRSPRTREPQLPRAWAATRSVAKALGPDLRLAVLAGDPHTIARVRARQQCGPGWVSHILQTLVLELSRDPAVGALVARAGATYSERRERLLARLAHEGVEAYGASGLNVWIPVGEEAGTVGALMQRGWVLAPGAPYRLPGAPPAVRVTTATLSEQQAGQLAHDIAEVLAPSSFSRNG